MLLNRVLYAIFAAFGVISPVLSVFICDLLDLPMNIIAFLWVGLGLRLPTTLLLARLVGKEAYEEYWTFLTSFPGHSRTGLKIGWPIATLGFMVVGLISLVDL